MVPYNLSFVLLSNASFLKIHQNHPIDKLKLSLLLTIYGKASHYIDSLSSVLDRGRLLSSFGIWFKVIF